MERVKLCLLINAGDALADRLLPELFSSPVGAVPDRPGNKWGNLGIRFLSSRGLGRLLSLALRRRALGGRRSSTFTLLWSLDIFIPYCQAVLAIW